MTPKQLERIALSLPEAHEEPHFARRSFRVGKKIFATMTADGAEAMVGVEAKEARDALLADQPDVFFSYGGWTERNGSLGVRLARADAALVKELLIESYKRVAPKRALAELVGEPKKPAAPRTRGARGVGDGARVRGDAGRGRKKTASRRR
jgi:hypothetical protein